MIRYVLHRTFSPAVLVALLALTLVGTTTAVAAVVVTSRTIQDNTIRSRDIRDSTIQGRDVKNGSLGASDLAATAKGARAVATVFGDAGTNSCTIIASQSRNFTSCLRLGAGFYTLTLASGVSTDGTFPMCSSGGNGGLSTIGPTTCDVGYDPGNVRAVRVRVSQSNLTTNMLTGVDSVPTIPVVVSLP
jgi:hypothetical protein